MYFSRTLPHGHLSSGVTNFFGLEKQQYISLQKIPCLCSHLLTVADPGDGPGEPVPPPSLFLDRIEAQRAEKKILETWMTGVTVIWASPRFGHSHSHI